MDIFSGDQCRDRWKSRLTISCDYTVAIFNTQIGGVSPWGLRSSGQVVIYLMKPSHSFENAIEAGYQVAKDWSMCFARSSLIVCRNWGCAWELVRSFCTIIVTWSPWHIIYIYLGFSALSFPIKYCVHMCDCLWF